MTKRSWIRELWLDLQDPHHVAHFQQMCGVHGSFSRSPAGGSGGGGELDRTRVRNNGSIAGGSEKTGSVASEGGEGENPTSRSRRSICASTTTTTTTTTTSEGESETPSTNGTVLSNAAGERVGAGGVEPRSIAAGGTGTSPGSTVKPLRKNSLTGDAGHEFRIENRLLYYLFTLGTELGNESFYITFFPFLMWNVDAFVGRRVVMVWVWVMYLGQCTKDLVGWQRPASPPVVKVEMFYNSEYSMPSTHAMSGTALPFSLFFLTYGRWEVGVCVVLSVLYFVVP